MKKSTVCKKLGIVIRKEREKVGLSQEKLADVANVHRNYMGSVERGECSAGIDNIVKIARALNLTAAELLAKAEL